MRYDDPKRPVFEGGATASILQVNGSPLPVITLMRPMQSEGPLGEDKWGWLACVHAHKGTNRFGTYYGWIGDLGEFQEQYLADPEAALLRWFKYSGPEWEPTENAAKPRAEITEDLWGDG